MNAVHLKRLINIAMKLTELLEISNPFKVKPKLPKIEPVLNPEAEIAGAKELKPGKISLPANASSWTPEKQLAFKDGADHLANVLYNRQKKGIKTSTLEAYQEVQKKVGPEHIKDTAFVQDVFEAARKSANERIAADAEALKGSPVKPAEKPAETKPKDSEAETKPKEVPAKDVGFWGKYDDVVKWGIWGGNGAAAGLAVKEYYDAKELATRVVQGKEVGKDGKPIVWSEADIDAFSKQQHLKLVGVLAELILIPKVPMAGIKLLRWIMLLLPATRSWISKLLLRTEQGVTKALAQDKEGKIVEWTDRMLNTAWAAFVAVLLSPAKFNVPVDIVGGKVVTEELTLRQLLVALALHAPWKGFTSAVAELAFNGITAAWNAALQSVTGMEATTLATDLKRAQQASQPVKPTTQPAATPVKPTSRRDPDGVEVINWD